MNYVFYYDRFGHLNIKSLDKWVNETNERLTALEKKDENNVSIEFKPERVVFGCSYNRDIGFSAEVVDQKLYDKLEAKHESDCRLISEYDMEIKKLKEETKKIVEGFGKAKKERDHYKGLYSSKCDNYDKLLEKQIKTEKELKHAEEVGDNYKLLYDTTCGNYDKLEEKYNKLLKDYNLLSESNNNHATDNNELEGELEAKSLRIAALEEKLRNQRTNLASLQEKYEDAREMNKMREDVYYSNIKLKKTIESKDIEIGLLRAELDKFRSDDEEDYD